MTKTMIGTMRMRIGKMIKVTRQNLVSVIYSPQDGGCKAYVKVGDRYYYREYKNNAPKCVVDLVRNTPATRTMTFNGEVISELHGSIKPFEPID